jgi:hypothetical protein
LTVSSEALKSETSYGTVRRSPPAVPRTRNLMELSSFVALLLDHGVVVYDISEIAMALWDIGVVNRDDSFRIEKTNKFVSFFSFPKEAVWTVFADQ